MSFFSLQNVRYLSLFEGYSLLFLIFVAMPLKYFFDFPWGSKIVGPVHGAVFLIFVLQLFVLALKHKWGIFKTAWVLFVSSFVPFGAFYIDRRYFKVV